MEGAEVRWALDDLPWAVGAYLAVAYLLMPIYWRRRLRGVALPDRFVTRTPLGIAGDPVNLAFLGSEEAVVGAFAAAGWTAADPVTWRTALGIGAAVALHRPYAGAPVSPLLFEGRVQDMAWERALGRSPGRRHHLRLWRMGEDPPLWLGAASLDRSVGFSHRTGQVTHHIAPDLDAERDGVVEDLSRTGRVEAVRAMDGVDPLEGRNGGGDRFVTDGVLRLVVLRAP